MITKVGVPSKKVIVGINNYGRSFKMMDEGCTGPMRRFVAVGSRNQLAVAPGRCTDKGLYWRVGDSRYHPAV